MLCRSPSKLSDTDKSLYESVITGDARNTSDVEHAIIESKADYVVLATGNGADLSKSDTREKTGKALAQIMSKPAFRHVKAVVVSSHGAAETKIKVGMGIGMMITHYIRPFLTITLTKNCLCQFDGSDLDRSSYGTHGQQERYQDC